MGHNRISRVGRLIVWRGIPVTANDIHDCTENLDKDKETHMLDDAIQREVQRKILKEMDIDYSAIAARVAPKVTKLIEKSLEEALLDADVIHEIMLDDAYDYLKKIVRATMKEAVEKLNG